MNLLKKLFIITCFLTPLVSNAELITSVGVGKGILSNDGSLFERVGNIGYQFNLHTNFFIRPEAGYFADLSNDNKSSLWVAPLIGTQVTGSSGLNTHIAMGPGYLQNPDNVLGGHFQFSLEGGFGLTDKNVYLGLAWKHLSSAGIETPNNGRDFIVIQLGILNI